MTGTRDAGFLGEEFLTWLWFRTECGRGTFRLAGGEEVAVALEDELKLTGGRDGTEQSLRKGLPTRSPEATASLRAGRRLARARLVVAAGDAEWTVTLDGGRLSFGSVKPNDAATGAGEEDRDVGRMRAYLRLARLVEQLYTAYLRERAAPDFEDRVLPEMRAWLAAREEAFG